MEQEEIFQQPKKRQLKVYRKHISRSYRRYVIFPEIRLCGKWLQDIGFGCGQSVKVLHEKNKIIITVDNKTETGR
ncbi:MAG: SymE family type I addiction module toxin [Bacteroidota bacterium]